MVGCQKSLASSKTIYLAGCNCSHVYKIIIWTAAVVCCDIINVAIHYGLYDRTSCCKKRQTKVMGGKTIFSPFISETDQRGSICWSDVTQKMTAKRERQNNGYIKAWIVASFRFIEAKSVNQSNDRCTLSISALRTTPCLKKRATLIFLR